MQASLEAAARELGLSPAVTGIIPRGPAGLVEHFVAGCNTRMEQELAAMQPQLADMRVQQRIHTGGWVFAE